MATLLLSSIFSLDYFLRHDNLDARPWAYYSLKGDVAIDLYLFTWQAYQGSLERSEILRIYTEPLEGTPKQNIRGTSKIN